MVPVVPGEPSPAHPLAPALLAPALTLEEDSTAVLLVTAPETVARVFDEHVGRLDSHSGFGR